MKLPTTISVAATVTTAITLTAAHADPAPGAAYFYDGGAVPLFWLPLAGALAIDRWVAPRATPLMFDGSEGGAPRAGWEVPSWSVAASSVGLAVAMVASGDDSRWYHVKGLAQSMATSALVVSILKPAFGRHRPDWTADSTDPLRNTSFPSGHSTNAFVLATYAMLYLRSHVFDEGTSAWWQGAAYGGLYAGAGLIAAERVYHDRHHVTDVLAGAVIGTATSASMFYYQDQRARRGSEGSWALVPSVGPEAVTLGIGGAW